MKLDEFTEEIICMLQKELGNGYKIEKKTLDGLNGTKKHSLVVSSAGSGIFPCISMGEYYRRHRKGEDFRSLFQMILSECRSASPIRLEDMAGFLCWDSVKSHIYPKLVNTEKNEMMLCKLPHRQCLDLSLVYYVRPETASGEMHGSILIQNGHMKCWDADEETLFQTAWKNMESTDEMQLEDMNNIIKQMFGAGDFITAKIAEEPQMYVFSNKDRINGAVQMCSRSALKKAAESIGSDFWILPSSIHELILVPIYAIEGDALDLAELVRDVNNTQLQPEEILSYHVYRYSRDTEMLSIEA